MQVLAATHREKPASRHLIQGLNPLIWTLKEHGIDPAPLLSKANIHSSALSQPNFRLNTEQEINFIQQVVEIMKQPDLGLTIGSAYHLSAYGILGMAIMTSDDLLTAAKNLFHNSLMTWTYMYWSLSEDNGIATLSLTPLRDLGSCHQYMIDRGLIASYLIFKESLGRDLPLLEINIMQDKPDYSESYSALFDCEVNFNCEFNTYKFDAEYLYKQQLQADPSTNAIYLMECDKICRQLEDVVRFSDLIRQHVLPLDSHQSSLEAISKKIFLTPRTIQRKLAEEETSYKEILEEVRRTLAVEYLRTTDIIIEEIANKLGYNDASAFCHAFKRWTGKPPRDYRT